MQEGDVVAPADPEPGQAGGEGLDLGVAGGEREAVVADQQPGGVAVVLGLGREQPAEDPVLDVGQRETVHGIALRPDVGLAGVSRRLGHEEPDHLVGVERHDLPPQHRLPGRPARLVGGQDVVEGLLHLGVEFGVVDAAGHEPDPLRFGAVDLPGGEHEPGGPLQAHLGDEPGGDERIGPGDAKLGDPEPGGGGGDGEVGAQRQEQPAGVGLALHPGHHDGGRPLDGGHEVVAGGQQPPRLLVVDGQALVLGEVAAGGEVVALGLEEDDADVGIGVELPDPRRHPAHHGQRHGVALLRPRQHHPPDGRLPVTR